MSPRGVEWMLLSCLTSPATAGSQAGGDFPPEGGWDALSTSTVSSGLCVPPRWHISRPVAPFPTGGGVAVPAYCPSQTGEIVALKKVALRRLEDGIPNQALREIKALQEMEDNQYVSGACGPGTPFPALLHSLPLWGGPHPLCPPICFLSPHFLS